MSSIDQGQTLFSLQLQGNQSQALQNLFTIPTLTLVERFTLTNQQKAQMGQRREVPARSSTASSPGNRTRDSLAASRAR